MPFDKLVDCPALLTIRVVSGKWKTRILWSLRSGPKRFGELLRELPGSTPKVLTAQLRELENARIVIRHPSKQGAVEVVEYAYSDFGRTLIPALDALGEWGAANFSEFAALAPKRNRSTNTTEVKRNPGL